MDDNIFISIPSYKDDQCSTTLDLIYKNARNPEKVYCGVYLQIDPDKSTQHCKINSYIPKNHVRYIAVHHEVANGPLHARAIIMKQLYNGEKYILWIDAHTIFLKDWDMDAKNYLEYLNKTKKIKKPIISGYPADINNNEDATYLNSRIKENNEIWPSVFEALPQPGGDFYKSYFMAAGCMFTYGKFYSEALNRIDFLNLVNNLGPIFNGEELILALIAYINNWEIYSIPHTFIKHKYKSNDDKLDDGTHFSKGMTQENRNYLKYLVFSNKSCLNFKNRTVFDFYKKIGWSMVDDDNLPWDKRWPKASRDKLMYKTKIIKYNK